MPSEVPTSSTEPAPDPAVIPDDPAEIDEEYVQAVLDELFAVEAKAGEIFIATRTLDERAMEYLEAIYIGEELEQQKNVWFQDLALRADELRPGVRRTDVQRLLDVKADCVFLEAERDYSETTAGEAPPNRIVYLGLTPKLEGDDPEGLNPTRWMLFASVLREDDSEPENPCAGR
ncbi:MAG TPA: hypothetical protein VGR26_17090 [Acidimicrobiales bacterium]|nr:hypothetical protein [Acidimicrobiales bacterium]